MKKIMISIVCCGLLLTGCATKPSTPEVTTSTNSTQVNWPLYKIEKNGKIAYILGTIHIGKKEFYPFPEKLQTIFNESSVIVTEISADELSNNTTDIMKYLKTGDTFENMPDYSEADKQRLTDIAKMYDVSMIQLNSFDAWYMPTILQSIAGEKMGQTAEYGVDNQIYAYIEANGLKSAGFETVEFQMETLQSAYGTVSAREVLESLPTFETSQAELTALMDTYTADNCLADIVKDGLAMTPDAVATTRNQNWLPQIDAYLETETAPVFAFGFLHLCGNEGILKLLEDTGYTVTKESLS